MDRVDGLSVVVPIYQGEKYIDRCIATIINQTYKNLEIILVDDGSTDKSLKICKKYECDDNRIKVVHKENGGLSSARNEGIKYATKKFITFVDCDDWIAQDIYEVCMKCFNENDIDIVDFKCVFSNEYGYIDDESYELKKEEISGSKEILKDYLYRGQFEKAPFSVCKKIYKIELFNDIQFPNGKQNEDILTNYYLLGKCQKLIHVNKIGYYYYQNNSSLTNGAFKLKDEDLLYVCKKILELSIDKQEKSLINLSEIKLYRSYFSLLSKMTIYGVDESVTNIKQIEKQYIRELRKGYFKLILCKMPFNRKIIMTMFCINFPVTKNIIKRLKGR